MRYLPAATGVETRRVFITLLVETAKFTGICRSHSGAHAHGGESVCPRSRRTANPKPYGSRVSYQPPGNREFVSVRIAKTLHLIPQNRPSGHPALLRPEDSHTDAVREYANERKLEERAGVFSVVRSTYLQRRDGRFRLRRLRSRQEQRGSTIHTRPRTCSARPLIDGTAVPQFKNRPGRNAPRSLPGTQTYRRDGFEIHGESIRHPGAASSGCIILPPDIRRRLAASSDRSLTVAP